MHCIQTFRTGPPSHPDTPPDVSALGYTDGTSPAVIRRSWNGGRAASSGCAQAKISLKMRTTRLYDGSNLKLPWDWTFRSGDKCVPMDPDPNPAAPPITALLTLVYTVRWSACVHLLPCYCLDEQYSMIGLHQRGLVSPTCMIR